MMSKPKDKVLGTKPDALFERIVSILEQARGNVVRAVNTNMVLAYWLIGREIVEEIQRGEARAKYGEKVIEELSVKLTRCYGKGFSKPVLWNFRQFYLTYPDRLQILFPRGRELSDVEKLSPTGRELTTSKIQHPTGTKSQATPILFPAGGELVPDNSLPPGRETLQGFSPQLSWSHYRALMRVENREARDFYDNPTIGLILCTEKSETVARYSVLNDRKQIFASKYLPHLPSEEELRLEINKERRLIEAALEDRQELPKGRES